MSAADHARGSLPRLVAPRSPMRSMRWQCAAKPSRARRRTRRPGTCCPTASLLPRIDPGLLTRNDPPTVRACGCFVRRRTPAPPVHKLLSIRSRWRGPTRVATRTHSTPNPTVDARMIHGLLDVFVESRRAFARPGRSRLPSLREALRGLYPGLAVAGEQGGGPAALLAVRSARPVRPNRSRVDRATSSRRPTHEATVLDRPHFETCRPQDQMLRSVASGAQTRVNFGER